MYNRPSIALAALVILALFLSSCQIADTPSNLADAGEQDWPEVSRYKYGTYFDEESGWCWEFQYNNYSKEVRRFDPNARIYHFWGTNLRYRYEEEYYKWNYYESWDGSYYKTGVKPGILQWGSHSEAQIRDMTLMRSIISSDRTPEELLALQPEDYCFETLDGQIVFTLIQETLQGPYLDEMSFSNLYSLDHYPKSALLSLVEPGYTNGIKFQVVYVCQAIIGNLYIDALYQTGPEYNDYIQLSDLVEEGKATEEQITAFKKLQEIRLAVLRENNFIADAESYKDLKIGNMDFSKLYEFLLAIHESRTDDYLSMFNDGVPTIDLPITKEEYEAHTSQGN